MRLLKVVSFSLHTSVWDVDAPGFIMPMMINGVTMIAVRHSLKTKRHYSEFKLQKATLESTMHGMCTPECYRNLLADRIYAFP